MAYVELGKFRLQAGVSNEALFDAERAIRNGRIQQQPGYLGRELGHNGNGEWLILIRWESQAAGEAWSPIFMQDPSAQAFIRVIDMSTMRQEHYTIDAL
jgi:heme-degrading monooxygenase HmoA